MAIADKNTIHFTKQDLDTSKKDTVVYKAVSPEGKVYIGITTAGLSTRKRRHISDAKAGSKLAFHSALRKYDFDFSWEILAKVDTYEAACNLEKSFIEKFDSYDNGYNMTLGGDTSIGFKHSPKSKALMSLIKKNKPLHPNSVRALRKRMTENHPMLGKTHSDKARNKIRESALGRKSTKEAIEARREGCRAPVSCYDKLGNKIATFDSLTDACQWLGIPNAHSGISRACKNQKYTSHGYFWRKEVK